MATEMASKAGVFFIVGSSIVALVAAKAIRSELYLFTCIVLSFESSYRPPADCIVLPSSRAI